MKNIGAILSGAAAFVAAIVGAYAAFFAPDAAKNPANHSNPSIETTNSSTQTTPGQSTTGANSPIITNNGNGPVNFTGNAK